MFTSQKVSELLSKLQPNTSETVENITIKFSAIFMYMKITVFLKFYFSGNALLSREIVFILFSGSLESTWYNIFAKICIIVMLFLSSNLWKATEIKWKEKEKFKNCVLMMVLFHMSMTYVKILSKRSADAGLKDAPIQSTAERSVDWALCGKMYNQRI